jgi:hypothetical protein
MRRKRLLKTACLVTPLAALLAAAPAMATEEKPAPKPEPLVFGDFDCRASVLRVNVLGINLEPFVANRGAAPCVTDKSTLLEPTNLLGLLKVGLLQSDTWMSPVSYYGSNVTGTAKAEARVADVDVNLLGLRIKVDLLNAKATYSCANGVLSQSAYTEVADVSINGQHIKIPSPNANVLIDLGGLGKLWLNQVVKTDRGTIARALYLDSPLAEIAAAEAKAGFNGENACAADDPKDPKDPDPKDPDPKDPKDPDPKDPKETTDPKDTKFPNPAVVIKLPAGAVIKTDVKADVKAAVKAAVKLRVKVPVSISGPRGCATKSFVARVKGTDVLGVQLRLDGRLLKAGRSKLEAWIDLRFIGSGKHRIVAKVTLRTGLKLVVLDFKNCHPKKSYKK